MSDPLAHLRGPDGKVDLSDTYVAESWLCVDCGMNTAPGIPNRIEMEKAFEANPDGVKCIMDDKSEVYLVRDAVWIASGMEPGGGCLCIGCLEKRLGRKLKPKDFLRDHAFNSPRIPGTRRLLERRGRSKGLARRGVQ